MKGHYIGSYEDLYMLHCKKAEEIKNEVNYCAFSFPSIHSFIHPSLYVYSQLAYFTLQQLYKSEYEDIKTRCFFPQTITPEYEAGKKLQQCNEVSGVGS